MTSAGQSLALDVLGAGLVSPMALTPEQHVAFAKADTSMATGGAFIGRDGEPVDAIYCAWLDPRAALATRLSEMALRAASGACGTDTDAAVPTVLITEAPWLGLAQTDLMQLTDALAKRGFVVDLATYGAGSVGGALGKVAELSEQHERVLIVAVDSYISPVALPHRAMTWSDWERSGAPASEGAAALCVGRGASLASLVGRLCWTGACAAASTDDNDEPVDGNALTQLLQSANEAVPRSYGQHTFDTLREQAWSFAATRCHALLGADHAPVCIEERTGRLGAAAALAPLVFGLHEAPAGTRLASWCVSRDGTRSLCIAEVAA